MLITIGFKNLLIIVIISIVLIVISLGGSIFKMCSFLNPLSSSKNQDKSSSKNQDKSSIFNKKKK
jgi:hypothetical protein